MPDRSAEERLHALEIVVTALTDKTTDVGHLSVATEELAKSATRVENVLAASAAAQKDAREARADAAGALEQLARGEHRYRRRSRMLAVAAITVNLLTTAGTAAFFVHWTNQTNRSRYELCQKRTVYDTANHTSTGADVTYYRTQLHLIHINRANTEALIRSFPPIQAAAFRIEERASVRALKTALAAKETAFAAGVVGQCGSLPH